MIFFRSIKIFLIFRVEKMLPGIFRLIFFAGGVSLGYTYIHMYHVCIDSISYQSPTRCQGKAGRADSLNNSSSLVHTYPTFPFSITYARGLLLMRTHGFVNRCHRSSFVLQKSRQQSVHFQLTQSHDSINTGEPDTLNKSDLWPAAA